MVFNHLDVESLKNCLTTYGKELLEYLAEKQIVLDGKKLKGMSPTGTQTKIAELIREGKGHYLLSVKGNQNELLEDIQCAFKTHQGYDQSEETDCDHGRIETRRCSILPAKDFLLEENLKNWKDIVTLVKIDACREIKGVQTKETRYYISDENLTNAAYYRDLVRGH